MITVDDLSLNRALHEREAWCVDNLEFNKDKIKISGWAFPKNGDWRSVNFFLNDQAVDFEYGLDRDDLTEVFPFCSSANQTGFSITVDRNDISALNGFISVSRKANYLASKYSNYYFPIDRRFYKNLPNEKLRKQVHGSDSKSAFVLEGFSCFKKIDFIVQEYSGKDLSSLLPILDWGCGCGRVSRFFPNISQKLHGSDINSEAISWCQSNSFNNFISSDNHPPLPYEDCFFNVCFGVSILTHLSFQNQVSWIRELVRITKKGGLIILSFHGFDSVLRLNLSKKKLNLYATNGFVDLGPNNIFCDQPVLQEEYLDTVQSHLSFDEITRSLDVEISFIEGVFGNHQDVLVIHKK